MNEKIKQLAKQSNIDIDGMGYGEGNVEEFARLIVQDCITSLNIAGVPKPIQAGLNLGKVAIEDHFGVK